jgi:peptidyl-prolyl cis-trans isomerase D
MIRFLQRENRLTKALFIVIIAAASIGMVIYLIPGLTGLGASSSDTYAMVYPHWFSRIFSSGESVSLQRVTQLAQQQMQSQGYPDNAMILNLLEQRIGQQLVQQKVLLLEAKKLGINVTDDDVVQYLHRGSTGQVIFPNGHFIGDDNYARLISERLNISVKEFEDEIKTSIIAARLKALITAGVTVSDQEARETYRKQNIKIKFAYAVISTDDLSKSINPTDSDLEAFFKKNAARYAKAVSEERKISYFAFTSADLPGGATQPSQLEIQQYYAAHKSEYETAEQARSRHILIKVAEGADAKTDAAAKAKAEGLLKQITAGANFADLAKKYSEDSGSKSAGGELGFAKRGTMVSSFDTAIFSQKIGETKIVKTQYGYHIIQVEERQAAHTQQLSEVEPAIKATLIRQKQSQVQENYAHTLTSEAVKNGLEKTAAAHHLQVVTSPSVSSSGVIAALPDSSQLIEKAFASKQTDPPQYAQTGEGYAVFQVTGITAAHAPNLAEYKSKIADDYREEQLPKLLAQKTTVLAETAKNLNDLPKAAKAIGAKVMTSDLVGMTGQVPDFGQVGQVAPQLFDLSVGNISGPINAQRTGVVAKLLDKQEPTADEINKHLDEMRSTILDERRNEAFNVFMSGVLSDYKKHKKIMINSKAISSTEVPAS